MGLLRAMKGVFGRRRDADRPDEVLAPPIKVVFDVALTDGYPLELVWPDDLPGLGGRGSEPVEVVHAELSPGETVVDWCLRALLRPVDDEAAALAARVSAEQRARALPHLLGRCTDAVFAELRAVAHEVLAGQIGAEDPLVRVLETGERRLVEAELARRERLVTPTATPARRPERTASAGLELAVTADGFVLLRDEPTPDGWIMTLGERVVIGVDGRAGVRFRLSAVDPDLQELPDGPIPSPTRREPPAGAWSVRILDDAPGPTSRPVKAPAAMDPIAVETPWAAVTAYATVWGTLAIRIDEPLPQLDDEERLAARLAYARDRSVAPNTVFAETYGGQDVTDSPLAITDTLAARGFEGTIWWSVASLTQRVPPYATPILRETDEWYRALSTAQFILNNNTFPWWFHKNDGQTYIQTWHGSPWKRIGLDQPRHTQAANYREVLRAEPQAWDYLLAASDDDAAAFATAFASPARVLVGVLPRNDALLDADEESVRAARERAEVTASGVVTAYLPTWRESSLGAPRGLLRRIVQEYLSVWSAEAGPADRLLLRAHHEASRDLAGLADERILDVSRLPINDVLLAADRLVTDYSSSLFDYALLGRPIEHVAPDRGYYADYLRGFYDRPLTPPSASPRLTEALVDLIMGNAPSGLALVRRGRENEAPTSG